MLASVAFITLVYLFVALLVVFPSTEVVSAGVTVEGVLGGWLGSESLRFIQYHTRRTAATIITHALLIPGYVLVLVKSEPGVIPWLSRLHPSLPQLLLTLCLLPTVTALVTVAVWYRDDWRLHPLTRNLDRLSRPGETGANVAAEINTEFRRIDKFASSNSHAYRVVATDTWLIHISRTSLRLLRHRDARLSLTTAVNAPSPDNPTGTQVISLSVSHIRGELKPFFIRVSSVEYSELVRKLAYPVVNPTGLAIEASLADRFLPAFAAAVANNPTLPHLHMEDSMCIGCMEVEANVKLQRLCGQEERAGGRCVPCDCRPLWCLSCLSKWFAARQDQSRPELWLSSRSPCPTCRAPFCVLDVCLTTRTPTPDDPPPT